MLNEQDASIRKLKFYFQLQELQVSTSERKINVGIKNILNKSWQH